ncbi:GNAT family N-acetyltransferase [Nitrospirillum amazonense]|uniref:N-acetylglutamate synthase-like GNAT family acetyltransferase n=1 Tax=Nitrospirillum amazonense TaxID=28077 RepID=A0A560KH96_9PROT|nr:GNAT family N-acetyltransferase [Nitrospirillum amazonense]MDG3443284.1 GNAT family N-acetyltransferase [Nitrospirillum amazonense]TWB82576.1 N-acetylglutamate synthase-like GNAT family acetyltransferase [Nitrospirillum amazonense]
MAYTLRKATLADKPALQALIQASARGLSGDHYTPEVVEGALAGAFGVDSDLIHDQTYFVAEEADGLFVGCGGWSRRMTLFGGDARPDRSPQMLDPARDPARIRAFFVHPQRARQGIGRALLEACEAEARAAGFQALELMGTLPGVPLYRALGFHPTGEVLHPLPNGQTIAFVPMRKELGA